MASVTLFVGAQPYLLTEQEALRLAQLLRAAFTRETTDEAAAARRLGREVELVVDEVLDGPLEIGWPQAAALVRAIPEVTAHAYAGLEVLLDAARRLADAP